MTESLVETQNQLEKTTRDKISLIADLHATRGHADICDIDYGKVMSHFTVLVTFTVLIAFIVLITFTVLITFVVLITFIVLITFTVLITFVVLITLYYGHIESVMSISSFL